MSWVERRDSPRAIIHKRILDVAESRPDASIEAIAEEIGGATPDLVERVLGEYGDPAGGTPEAGEQESAMPQNGQTASAEPTETEDERPTLTEKQHETLRLVHENPDASQAEIAAALDVSRATVSRRLNDVPGFEWHNSASFTADLFDDNPGNGPALGDGDDGGGPESGAGDRDGATNAPTSWRSSRHGSRHWRSVSKSRVTSGRSRSDRIWTTGSSTPAWSPTGSPKRRSSSCSRRSWWSDRADVALTFRRHH